MSRIVLCLSLFFLFSVPLPGLNLLNKTCCAIDKYGLIKGRVIDAETKATVGFANVSLFRQPDTIPIQVTATDTKGEFIFTNLKAGSYKVKVHFMGFKNFTTPPILLTGQTTVFHLETIAIQIESQSLDEITIRAGSGNPSYQPEKKTIYVENQLSGTGGTAYDLLQKLPSVTQSPDGQIAIHGNTNLLVYINGKPSSMKGTELLEYTTAAEIKKIEMITSPSARYDASGSGGIINLITKKKSLDGFNGNAQINTDHLGGITSDLLLNYKHNKVSFFAGIDKNRRRNEGDVDYVSNYLSDQTRFTQSGVQKSQRTNTGIRSGFDYLATQSDKISVSGHTGTFETNNNGDWHTVTTELPQNRDTPGSTTDRNNRQGNYSGADFTYEHKFKTPGKSISISALWNALNYDDHYLNLISDRSGNEQMNQSTLLNKKNNNYQINADYTVPAGKAGNLEIGFQLSFIDEKESYLSVVSIPPPSVTTNQETRFNGMVGAGYGTWQLKINKFEVKAGLRTEYLNREMKTLHNRYPLHRFDPYPSLNSSFKIDSSQQILFNYTRRTDLLKTIQLDPLPRWYNFYNVMMGNPDLKNEVTDKIAIDYLVNFHKLTLVNELYFYNTANKIEGIQSLYHDGIIQNQYENIGSEKTMGVEINANWCLNNWMRISEKLDFIDSQLDIRLNQISKRKGYQQWYSVTSANLTISPTTLLEVDLSYYGPALTSQSKVDQCYLAGLSFRKTFFDRKLTFSVSGRDVLRLYKKVEHVQGTDFDQVISTYNKFPIRFTLSYKFNHFSRDERKIAKAPLTE